MFQLVAAGFTSTLLLSVSFSALALDNNAQSVKVGEADLFPSVRLEYVTESNGGLSANNETSVTGVILSPEAQLVADRRLLSIELAYRGSYAVYSENILDFDDHTVSAAAKATLSSRQRVAASFNIIKGHDRLGTGITLGDNLTDNTEQPEHLSTVLNASYVFGAQSAKGNLVGGLAIRNKGYMNNSETAQGNDVLSIAPFVRFAYRLSSDNRIFTELRFRKVDFDEVKSQANFVSKDRTEVTPSIGIAFSETGKTGGEARIGFTLADYDENSVDDTTLLSAAVNLYFEPSNISRFDLRFNRQLNDVDSQGFSSQVSDAIDDSLSLQWIYNVSGFVTTRASLGLDKRNRRCPATGTTTSTGGVEVSLKPRRWLAFGAGVQVSQRTDDNCAGVLNELEYDKQTMNVFVRATL